MPESTDTSEQGLERLIWTAMTGAPVMLRRRSLRRRNRQLRPSATRWDPAARCAQGSRASGGGSVNRRHTVQTSEPVVLRWARERAGYGPETLASKVGVRPDRVLEWERSGNISISQADRLARHTHTPVSFLYLREPSEDDLPIPDFRAAGDARPAPPRPDLLKTVHLMARRQAWMRNELIEDGADPLPFVGCCGADSTPGEAATVMREHLVNADRLGLATAFVD